MLFGPNFLKQSYWNIVDLQCCVSFSCTAKWFICTCMCAKLLQSCPTLCDPTDCSPSGSSVHGILQARILESVAMPSSRGLPDPGIEPTSHKSPALVGWIFTTSTTWEALRYTYIHIYIYKMCIYIYIFFFCIIFHWKLLQDIECSFLYYRVDPCWLSILYIVVCVF